MPEDTRKCEPPIAETPARGGLACAEGFRGRFFCQQLVLVLTGCDDGHILSRSLKENKDLREATPNYKQQVGWKGIIYSRNFLSSLSRLSLEKISS